VTTAETRSPAAARAWRAATVDHPIRWRRTLPAESLAVLQAELRRLRERPVPLPQLCPDPEALAVLRRDLRPALGDLEQGRGFVILRGLEPGWTHDQSKAAYWLVGCALGAPFEQNVQGTLLYDVRDTGRQVSEGVRFSVTNADSSFHTDNSFGDTVLDYVGLLCLQAAKSGGVNQMVSGYTAAEVLRRRSPGLYEILCRPFHVDRRGGVRPGESPTARVPVFLREGEELLVRYLRYWIHEGHARAGEPLTADQERALDLLDEVLQHPELRVEFSLEPGDMFWLNNRWTLHNRTAFEDHPESERRRHLVRLWVRRPPASP
jgi:alpha-ketoglutarate-dependent taurine dioxygenase